MALGCGQASSTETTCNRRPKNISFKASSSLYTTMPAAIHNDAPYPNNAFKRPCVNILQFPLSTIGKEIRRVVTINGSFDCQNDTLGTSVLITRLDGESRANNR